MKIKKLLIVLAVLALLLLAYCTITTFSSDSNSEAAPPKDLSTQCTSDEDCTGGTCGTSRGIQHGLIYREKCIDNVCSPSGSSYCGANEECVNDEQGPRCSELVNSE